jgi:hypothetical protein
VGRDRSSSRHCDDSYHPLPGQRVVFADQSLQLVSRDNVDGWTGRLVEDSGPGRAMRLQVEVPLLDGEGDQILGPFLSDRALSPVWEQGSHDGNGSS